MTIDTEEIYNLFGSGNHLDNTDYFTPLFDINLLDEDIQELETKEIYYLSAYFERTMLDRFLIIARRIDDVISNGEINSTNIVNYLTIKEAFDKYQLTFIHLEQLLESIKRQNERATYNYLSKESAEFLIDKHFSSLDSDRIQELIDEDGENYRKFIGERIDSELSFLKDIWYHIFIEARFRYGNEMMEYVISEFRRFVKMDKYHLPPKLKVAAQHFKSDRLETVSKPHWAKLAEADEELIRKIINDEPVDAGACAYLYDTSELKDLKKNKMLLSFLRETSDPENLFDWSILFSHDELFEQYVTFENVMFFFGRIHRDNLIKCEMYDDLKEQYHKFIYGDEEDKTETPAPTLPKTENLASEQEQMEPQPSASPEEHYIHQQIDEDKLIAFIRSYTDGPNKSNYFVNKSHWISIYTVLHQKLKSLGNSSVFLYKSRPKFVKWVNTKIKPKSVPCDQGALDNAPEYFRDEKKYPWTIEDYYKSGGTQESTYNSYSMVADYFQRNLIDKLDEFFSFSS